MRKSDNPLQSYRNGDTEHKILQIKSPNSDGVVFLRTQRLRVGFLICFDSQPHKFLGDAEQSGELARREVTIFQKFFVGYKKTHRKQIRFILKTSHTKPRFRPQKVGIRRRVQKHVSQLVCRRQPLLDFGQVLIYMYKLLSADGVEIPVYRPQIFEQNDNPKAPRQLKRVGGVIFFSDFLNILFHFQLLLV